MHATTALPQCSFSIKCRIGIDYNDSFDVFQKFIEAVSVTDGLSIDVHARKVWLQGLSPKQNRTIPPVNYDFVYEIAKQFPSTSFSINGDIKSLAAVQHHLENFPGRVMLGRGLYENPILLYVLSLSLDKSPNGLKITPQLINEKRMAVVKEYASQIEEMLSSSIGNSSIIESHLKYPNLLAPLMGIYSGTPVSTYFKHQLRGLLQAKDTNFSVASGIHKNLHVPAKESFSENLNLVLIKTQRELKRHFHTPVAL